MLGKKSQWLATINGDEILGEELRSLIVIEETGLNLPTMHLNFVTRLEDKVKKYATPGYKVVVGFGKDSIESVTSFRLTTQKVRTMGGFDNWEVEVKGVMDNFSYLWKQQTFHYNTWEDMKKSTEVWSEVCGRNGLTPDLALPSNDKMLWLQHNNTDRQFLEEVAWHGFFASNDPALTTIKRDSKALYKPISKLLNKKGVLGNIKGATFYSNDFTLSQDEGFLTMWGGKERTIPVHKLEEGTDEEETGSISPKIAPKIGIVDTSRIQETAIMNDNVHKKWWEAYRQNRQYRSSMSASSIGVSLNRYYGLYPLDAVEVKYQRQSNNELLVPFNGLWLISKVLTGINHHEFIQNLTLCRETLL
jgi:hypothetical protein